MAMKIVNPRGQVTTADEFKRKLGLLIQSAVEAANAEPQTSETERTHVDPKKLRQQAAQSVQAIGLDPSTKEGKAAAGASMLTDTIAAGFRQYEKKTGHPVPRSAMMTLEDVLAKEMISPPRGKVQNLKDIKNPWKP